MLYPRCADSVVEEAGFAMQADPRYVQAKQAPRPAWLAGLRDALMIYAVSCAGGWCDPHSGLCCAG